MKFLFAAACLIVILCCLEYAEAADKKIVTVIVGTANLREEPSLDSKGVNFASKGAVLEVTGEFTEPTGKKWYKVKTSSRELWLADKVVELSVFKAPDKQGKVEKSRTTVQEDLKKAGSVVDSSKQGPEGKDKKEDRQKERGPAPIKGADEAPEKDVRKAPPEKAAEDRLQELLDTGNAFFREGKCEEFIAAYLKAIDIVEKQKDITAEGKLHYNISECYTRLKKYQESLRHLDEAIVMAGKTDNKELEILALIDKSRVSVIMGDKNRAIEILKAASEKANREMFLRTSMEDNLKALISFQMAGVLFQLGEKDKAKGKLEYALTVNSDFKMEEDIMALLKTVDVPLYGQIASVNKILEEAWGLYEKGDYQGMEKGSGNALDIAKRLGYKKGVFGGHYYLAMASISMEKYDGAIDHALHAQELAEKGLDRMRLGMVYNLTGNIFKQKKAFDKALHYYSKDLEIMRSSDNREGESVALNNIGNTLMDKGEYRDALVYYEGSLKAGLEINTSRHFIAQGHLSVGRAKNKTGDYAGAEKSIIRARNIFRELDNTGGEMVCLWELAANYALQGEYKTAVKILEDNLNSAERSGMKRNFIDDIVVYSEKAKDYLKAEKYRKK